MKKFSVAAAAALTLLAAGLAVTSAAPASAVTVMPPRLVSPLDRATVPTGWAGPVKVDMSTATSGVSFHILVNCDGNTSGSGWEYAGDGGPNVRDIPLDAPLDESQSCQVIAHDQYNGTGDHPIGTFTVVDSPVHLTSATLSTAGFYPLVYDHYFDYVTLSWRADARATHTVSVRNSAGQVVRRVTLPSTSAGAKRWTWNGRNSAGRVVPVGNYRMTVYADGMDGSRSTISRTVAVRTKVVAVRKAMSRTGYSSSRSTRGSCYATRDSWEHTTNLDCWGGRYAHASYGFTLPRGAYSVRWRVSGTRPFGDICCQGSITRTAKRVSATGFRVTVAVTGWRAYDVRSVAVSYAKRIRR